MTAFWPRPTDPNNAQSEINSMNSEAKYFHSNALAKEFVFFHSIQTAQEYENSDQIDGIDEIFRKLQIQNNFYRSEKKPIPEESNGKLSNEKDNVKWFDGASSLKQIMHILGENPRSAQKTECKTQKRNCLEFSLRIHSANFLLLTTNECIAESSMVERSIEVRRSKNNAASGRRYFLETQTTKYSKSMCGMPNGRMEEWWEEEKNAKRRSVRSKSVNHLSDRKRRKS